jgi:hypothetical protein
MSTIVQKNVEDFRGEPAARLMGEVARMQMRWTTSQPPSIPLRLVFHGPSAGIYLLAASFRRTVWNIWSDASFVAAACKAEEWAVDFEVRDTASLNSALTRMSHHGFHRSVAY